MPTSSFALFLLWWIALSALATGVLVLGDRLSRKALPLVALLRLSLIFPDRAPSRFRTALRAGTVQSLEERIADAAAAARSGTPVEAAERLLELVAALDIHDHVTRGHAERVRAYAQMIAEEMRLGKTDRDLLNWAALLHDVGKLAIPSEILTKPGRLTEEEYAAIKHHSELGEEFVAPLRSWLGEWAQAVGDHHERWDGKGYPRGKAGEGISVGGRIVAVADVFDVITSARSYKDASTTIEARKELARNAGTQFDERMVRAFLGVSLGRLRLAMGPLAWLAHAPVLGRIPLTPAISSLSGALAVVAASVSTGLVAEAAPARPERAASPVSQQAAPIDGPRRSTPDGRSPGSQSAPSARRSSPSARPAPSAAPRSTPATREAATEPPAHPAAVRLAPHVDAAMDEDSVAVIALDGVTGTEDVAGLRVSEPPHVGEASTTSQHALLYRPPANFHGRTLIGYEVCWHDERCALGEARVLVRPVNDAPQAVDDAAKVEEDGRVSIDVLANDSDPDGDRLEVVQVAEPQRGSVKHGTTAVTYSPPPNFSGTATFTYKASDGSGGVTSGTVEVRIAPVNDSPRAVRDVASVLESREITIDVLANDVDPEGDAFSLASFKQPSLGTVRRTGDRLSFAAPGIGGSVSLEYVVRDTHGATDVGTVSITVIGVNDSPSFVAGSDQVIPEDAGAQSVALWAQSIRAGPADEIHQNVTFVATNTNSALFTAGGQPNVSPDGTLTFTSAPNAVGSATVTVHAHDDGGTANGGSDTSVPHTFTITVTNVNDPPVAVADTATVAEDGSGVMFSVLANDTDADAADLLSITSYDASGAGKGALTHNGAGFFTFAPQADYFGTQSFSYTISDGNGGVATGVATIVVTPVPDAPVAADDAYATTPNTPLDRRQPGLRANDGDVDGERVKVETTPVSAPSNGTVTLRQNGSFVYTPNTGFVGTDTFTYRVNDGTGLTDDAVVTITVSLAPTTLLYLGTSGPSSDVWDLTTSAPPAASPVPDFDGDGNPGISIYKGNGSEGESDSTKWQAWARPVTLVPLVLNGPVTVQLWSTIAGFDPHSAGHPHVYLYDCLVGGVACVKLAQSQDRIPDWNDGVADWGYREVSLGAVNRTILVGRELRLRVQASEIDLWVAMTAAYPSALEITGS
jgi:putative nucleotidyltransferase with HDIG domain